MIPLKLPPGKLLCGVYLGYPSSGWVVRPFHAGEASAGAFLMDNILMGHALWENSTPERLHAQHSIGSPQVHVFVQGAPEQIQHLREFCESREGTEDFWQSMSQHFDPLTLSRLRRSPKGVYEAASSVLSGAPLQQVRLPKPPTQRIGPPLNVPPPYLGGPTFTLERYNAL